MSARTATLPMLRKQALAVAVVLAMAAAPALAQEMDHSKMHMPAPKPTPVAKKPAAKVPVAKKPVAKKPLAKKAMAKKPAPKQPTTPRPVAADPHAGHAMPAPAIPASTAVDHAAMGHAMPPPQPATRTPPVDHAAMGHGMPTSAHPDPVEPVDHAAMGHGMPMTEADTPMEPMDHAAMGHDMSAPQDPAEAMDHAAMGHAMPVAPTEPRTPIPVLTQADRVAAFPDVVGHAAHDNATHSYWLLDRLEAWNADQGTGVAWEAKSWIGTDLDRVWLRSEGEHVDGITEAADLEVLYGRSIAPWWDVVAGVRHDLGQGPSQTFAAFGVMGLAPYKYEVEATAYIGQSGQTAARVELEYDTLLTNRWVLQSLVEAEWYGKDDERRGIGSGLSTAEVGFRLRYEFTRKFAPYIGVVRERAFGDTAGFRRHEGDDTDDTRFIAGLRLWF